MRELWAEADPDGKRGANHAENHIENRARKPPERAETVRGNVQPLKKRAEKRIVLL